jgi:carboxypeptidase Taq
MAFAPISSYPTQTLIVDKNSLSAAPYLQLEERFRRIIAVDGASDLLYWDQVTMMPEGGRASRAEQLAALSVHAHELLTAPETAEWLAAAEEASLDPWQAANLHEMRRKHAHATALRPDLVEAMSRAATACEAAWRQAKREDDFDVVRPFLAEIVNLSRQAAMAKAEKLGVSPYEALMDMFEPGARTAAIDAIFKDYMNFLPEFLPRVLEHQRAQPEIREPKGQFPIATQKALARLVVEQLGFQFENGRLDESPHPFCIGWAGDVRITTRYREDEAMQALMGVIHETGHALYERQLPADWRFQPVGRARGMVLHESQSLIFEMQAARTAAFCSFLSRLLREAFPTHGSVFVADNLVRLYCRVKPDFIRIAADEVTYPAHVVLRYHLEQALIGGNLDVPDLPAAWNDGMKASLGLDVRSDRDGCLQDAHWYEGLFGYFPFYTLGAMAAAQLFAAVSAMHPQILTEIEEGRFDTLRHWLGEHVHQFASSLSTDEVMERATGKKLHIGAFKRHLAVRYLESENPTKRH